MAMGDDDVMEYNKGKMLTLYSDLMGFHKALMERTQDMHDAARNLGTAWQNNAGLQGFQTVFNQWDAKDEELKTTLNKVAAAVESAMNRALGTDQKIGDGFGSI